MTDEDMTKQVDELKLLAMKYPGKDDYEIYLLDQIERLLTNSRDQTRYLKNISGIITALVILGKAELAQALERGESFGALVRKALVDTPRFHDGCWMYLRVSDPLTCRQDGQDIQQLILIKKKPPRTRPATKLPRSG